MSWSIGFVYIQNSIDLVVAVNPDADCDNASEDVKSPKTMWPPPE